MQPVRPEHPQLTIVIPCLNEEEVLPDLFKRLDALFAPSGVDGKVLLVDDGSTDRGLSLIRGQCERDPRFGFLAFSRNFGHQAAVSAGLRHAEGDLVAVLDADLQDPPEILRDMISEWREGWDVVYGVRQNRKEGFILRSGYAWFYRLMKKTSNIEIPLDAGDFCIMDRRVVDAINRLPERGRFMRGLRVWVGFRQKGIPYERAARAGGQPKYTLGKLVQLALDGLVSFSSLPLRIASGLGLVTSTVSMLLLIWVLASAFIPGHIPSGWASLAVMITFFAGIQLTVLGIFGEYLGRIFDEVKARPGYLLMDAGGWADKADGV